MPSRRLHRPTWVGCAGQRAEKIVAKIRSAAGQGRRDRPRRDFLIADDAGFVTGSTLSINGGQHMY